MEGEVYPTVEHAYQATKTTNPIERKQIQSAATPGRAKRLGNRVNLRPDWHIVKLDVMADLLRQKFIHNQELTPKLLATGDITLIEGNDWGDRYWGMVNGCGQNHLGRLLMTTRDLARSAWA